jgi:hypothetical protein
MTVIAQSAMQLNYDVVILLQQVVRDDLTLRQVTHPNAGTHQSDIERIEIEVNRKIIFHYDNKE